MDAEELPTLSKRKWVVVTPRDHIEVSAAAFQVSGGAAVFLDENLTAFRAYGAGQWNQVMERDEYQRWQGQRY